MIFWFLFLPFLFLLLCLIVIAPLIATKVEKILENYCQDTQPFVRHQTWILWHILTALFIAGSLNRSTFFFESDDGLRLSLGNISTSSS